MNGPGGERRLAAVLAADAVEYARLVSDDETGTIQRVRTAFAEVFGPAVSRGQGRVFKTMGDGLLAVFPSAIAAVTSALEIQEAIAAVEDSQADDRRLQFRIAVHLGDVVFVEEHGDILGDGVNVAARLQALADPGGIVVSQAVRDQVRNRITAALVDGGSHALKHIPEPVRIWRVRGATTAPPRPMPVLKVPVSANPVVAVLAFGSQASAESAPLADGFADDLATELARFASLFVIAPGRFGVASAPDAPSASAVATSRSDYTVEGSLRRAGMQVRITVRLVETGNATQLWAERYELGVDEIFAVQDEIVRRVVASIKVKVDQAELGRTARKPPSEFGAYEFCLKGFRLIDLGQKVTENLEEPRLLFERAAKLDPTYARAWLGLGLVELLPTRWALPSASATSLDVARRHALRAIECCPTEADCYWLLGMTHLWSRDAPRAVAAWERARALNPSHSDMLCDLGDGLTYLGRAEEAIAACELALRLNPSPHPRYHWNHAAGLYFARRFDEALAALERMPEPGLAWRLVAATLSQLGRQAEAEAAIRRLLEITPAMTLSHFARTQPYQDDAARDLYLEGLRKAGLPP